MRMVSATQQHVRYGAVIAYPTTKEPQVAPSPQGASPPRMPPPGVGTEQLTTYPPFPPTTQPVPDWYTSSYTKYGGKSSTFVLKHGLLKEMGGNKTLDGVTETCIMELRPWLFIGSRLNVYKIQSEVNSLPEKAKPMKSYKHLPLIIMGYVWYSLYQSNVKKFLESLTPDENSSLDDIGTVKKVIELKPNLEALIYFLNGVNL